jgi:hypothetical protein
MDAKNGFMPDKYVQIDVKKITGDYAVCNLYTGALCVEVVMKNDDYQALIRKGFFIRDGHEADSADVLNTTEAYFLLPKGQAVAQ